MGVLTSVLWFGLGVAVLVLVFDSAIRTFMLPRGASVLTTRVVFIGLRLVFDRIAALTNTYEGRDRVMALYGPIGLLVLPTTWLVMTLGAFTVMFHALGVRGFQDAFETSGSSLFTLGYSRPPDLATRALSYGEAAIGLALLALLIAYLPTIYAAFSRREALIAQLAVRGEEPLTGVNLLIRSHRMDRFHLLDDVWLAWQRWFAELEETHTSLAVLTFFRSPRPQRSWITSAGAVLDGASLVLSSIDQPFQPEAGACIRGGTFALRAVAEIFDIPFDADPLPTDPISIAKDEFFEAYTQLAAIGLPVKADREQAWRDFRGWRVNYDAPLLGIAGLVMAPYAPWSSDRSLRFRRVVWRTRTGRGVGPRG
jgi:hypothetical protein